MTPLLSALRLTGLLLLLLAGPVHTPYAAAYEPVPAESRAGSRAGEGRERPGREAPPTDEESPSAHSSSSESPDGEQEREQEREQEQEQEAPVAPEASGPPSAAPERPARPVDAHDAADRPVRASEPVLKVLPLGTGLVLIGLGLGLAFFALKARRT